MFLMVSVLLGGVVLLGGGGSFGVVFLILSCGLFLLSNLFWAVFPIGFV